MSYAFWEALTDLENSLKCYGQDSETNIQKMDEMKIRKSLEDLSSIVTSILSSGEPVAKAIQPNQEEMRERAVICKNLETLYGIRARLGALIKTFEAQQNDASLNSIAKGWITTQNKQHIFIDGGGGAHGGRAGYSAYQSEKAGGGGMADDSGPEMFENQFATQGYVGLSGEESDAFIRTHHNKDLLSNGSRVNDLEGEESGHIVYSSFNKRVANGTPNAADKKLMSELDDAIDSNSLPQDMVLFRGASYKTIPQLETNGKSLDEIKEQVNSLKGTEIAGGYYVQVSASSERSYYRDSDISFQIAAPKGTHAYISAYCSESEIVLGRNTKMEILGAEIVENVKDLNNMNAGSRITIMTRLKD